jgi:putative transposase
MRIFHRHGDYWAFLETMEQALRVQPMRLLGWCLMPNHWHLVLWPQDDGDLSRFVGWLSNTHVRRYHRFHELEGLGHLYQSRFKSFLIQQDMHLLTVLRYVETNALRAGLVQRAEQWPFCSLGARCGGGTEGSACECEALASVW